MQPSTTAQQNGVTVPTVASPRSMAAGIERIIVLGGIARLARSPHACLPRPFAVSPLGLADWNSMLLMLTTVVSLEAIYPAIFIQFSVNKQAASLKGVEEDVESIQEDVEELGEHVEA